MKNFVGVGEKVEERNVRLPGCNVVSFDFGDHEIFVESVYAIV